jgi:signal transduction histidine kinase
MQATGDKRSSGIPAALQACLHLYGIAAGASIEAIIDFALEEAVRLTGSTIGYFHFVNPDQQTIQLTTWSRATLQQCAAGSKEPHYPIAKAGVWVDCIHRREPVIHNNYRKLSHKKGLPQGHVPLQRDLGVPVLEQEKIIAVLGVGNKASAYTRADTQKVALLAETASIIIQRKRAENALRDSEQFLSGMFSSIQDGISVLNTDLTIRQVNAVMKRWYAQNLPLEGKKCYACYHNHTSPCDPCPTLRCLQSGAAEHEVVRGLPGSPVAWVEIFSYPMKHADSGEVTGVVEFIRNITGQKMMEEELLRAKKLETAGILAGGIAHDFNNLLMVILGNIGLAKRKTGDPEKLMALLEASETASLHMKNLVKKFFTFATGGALYKTRVRIDALLRDIATFTTADSAVTSDIAIAEDLRECDIDLGQMSQVIRGIIENAKEAMPAGGIVELRAENIIVQEHEPAPGLPQEPGRYVKITIRDQGIGIPEEELERVFDPYYSTKQRGTQKGMGLGLATAYAIVKSHGGSIHIASRQGCGTAVSIYLPASGQDDARPAGGVIKKTGILPGTGDP